MSCPTCSLVPPESVCASIFGGSTTHHPLVRFAIVVCMPWTSTAVGAERHVLLAACRDTYLIPPLFTNAWPARAACPACRSVTESTQVHRDGNRYDRA